MSRELLWELSRDSSCYVVRRGGHEFSREPGNLMNKNSYRYSTVAGIKTVAVKNNEKGATLILSCPKKTSQPNKSIAIIPLTKGKARAARTIHNVVALGYRPDLELAAVARVQALLKSHRLPTPLTKKAPRGRKAL